MAAFFFAIYLTLTDKHIVFHINAIDLLRCGSEEYFETFSHPSHDRRYLTCRDDDLLLDKLCRVNDL